MNRFREKKLKNNNFIFGLENDPFPSFWAS